MCVYKSMALLCNDEGQDHHHEGLVIDFGSAGVVGIVKNELVGQAFDNQAALNEVTESDAGVLAGAVIVEHEKLQHLRSDSDAQAQHGLPQLRQINAPTAIVIKAFKRPLPFPQFPPQLHKCARSQSATRTSFHFISFPGLSTHCTVCTSELIMPEPQYECIQRFSNDTLLWTTNEALNAL